MGLKKELEKRIEKKRVEIAELKKQVELSEMYLQAMLDTFRLIPKDEDSAETTLKSPKAGTELAKAYLAIKTAGHPLHITEILKFMEKPLTQQNKTSLTGSLGAYVRRGDTFTRPAPNTFGLKVLEVAEPTALSLEEDEGAEVAH
jgi:hypothetical protein